MIREARGRVEKGAIVLESPLALPDGTEVRVRVEATAEDPAPPAEDAEEFAHLPFFGMWADRGDLADSAEWVNRVRDEWQRRASQQA